MEINEIFSGFKLIEVKEIADIKSQLYHYIHEKTGAGLVYLKNDDNNKTFAVTFKTPPQDESGLTHILEHCVLSGSKKYPVKSPFLELRKSSLSTFLNAMTFADKTMYPVASMNDKDFQNLVDVYLDAVFNPLILEKEEIFLQEGWRFELDHDKDQLKYNGIVYNEMKGAYSSPDRLLISQIKKSLFPDNSYGLDSGGNPDYIPKLNYEAFKEYHKKYYHPSNAQFFFYGDLNIEDFLVQLDQEYLSLYTATGDDYRIPVQETFSRAIEGRDFYGISKDQDKAKKTYLSRSFLTSNITDKKEILALMILEKIFFDVTGSELKKRLMEAEIAEETDGFFYPLGRQTFFSFIARNSEEKNFPLFLKIIMDYLQELAQEGIDPELLTGAINSIEFRLRENPLSADRGINYAQSVMNSWLYGQDPAMYLSFSQEIKEIREEAEKGFFQEFIHRNFIKNKHLSDFLLLPAPGLEEEKNESIKKELDEIKKALTREEKEKIIYKNKMLNKYQSEGDSPKNLATIPFLEVSDINRKHEDFPLIVDKNEDREFLLHPVFTNKIVYLDLYFDTRRIPAEKIKYIYLLNDLMTGLSTENYDYQKLARLMNIYTGGIDFNLLCLNRIKTGDFLPIMRVSSKTFSENLDMTLDLILEIILRSKFSDKKRIKEELIELKAIKENEFLQDSMTIAQQRLNSYINPSGQFQENGNIDYFIFLKDLVDNFEDRFTHLAAELEWVAKNIFTSNNLISSITNDEESIRNVQKLIDEKRKILPESLLPRLEYDFTPENLREAIAIPSKVQYVIKGGNFKNKGFDYKGSMRVAAKILNTDYLWNKLRVQGGAYGGFASISLAGNLIMSSYRDPNLSETLDVYDASGQYFRDLNLDQKELSKFITGTIGDYDTPLSLRARGRLSNMYHFQEIPYEELQAIREEILDTSLEDLRSFAQLCDAVTEDDIYCVIGGEEKVQEEKNLFKKILKLI